MFSPQTPNLNGLFDKTRINTLSDKDVSELKAGGLLFKDFAAQHVVPDADGVATRAELLNSFIKWRQKQPSIMQFHEIDQAKNDVSNAFPAEAHRATYAQPTQGGKWVFEDCFVGYVCTWQLPDDEQMYPEFVPDEPEECSRIDMGSSRIEPAVLMDKLNTIISDISAIKAQLKELHDALNRKNSLKPIGLL